MAGILPPEFVETKVQNVDSRAGRRPAALKPAWMPALLHLRGLTGFVVNLAKGVEFSDSLAGATHDDLRLFLGSRTEFGEGDFVSGAMI